jgi:ankyrin repeat protein
MELTDKTTTINETYPLLAEETIQANDLESQLLYHGALGNYKTICDLLNQGADPNATDDKKMTVLHYAARYGYIEISDTLLKHPKLITTHIAKGEKSPFLLAIQYNHKEIIQQILALDSINRNQTLSYVAQKGLIDIVTMLLEDSDDIEILRRPLFAATREGHIHIIKFLIAKGADVKSRSKNNASLLHCAATMGHSHIVQFLIEECHADVNLQDNKYQSTPLHTAAIHGHVQIVKTLLRNNADINAKNDKGLTALHWAVMKNHIQVVQTLLAQPNIDIRLKDSDDKKPLDLAQTKEIKQLLMIHEKNKRLNDDDEYESDDECCAIQ